MRLALGIVGIAISALLVVVLVIPVTTPSENIDEWEYDDYRTISGAADADGALELSTIGGSTYVHAKNVGMGTITFENGSVKTIQVNPSHLDIYVIAGQSNTYASLYMDPSQADPIPAPGTAYYYGTSTLPTITENYDPDDCSIQDMIKTDGSCKIGSFWPALAKTYYEETGHKTYYLDIGLSGQPIATFLPGGVHWQHMQNVIHDGLGELDSKYKYDVRGYLWLQGEGDKTTPIPTYETYFVQIDNAFNAGDLGVKIPQAFIIKIREAWSESISDAQIWLADNLEGVHMLTEITDTFTVENGLMHTDDLHYSQLGCNVLGVDAGEKLPDYLPAAPATYDLEIYQILAIIPLIMIAGLIIVAVGLIIIRRGE